MATKVYLSEVILLTKTYNILDFECWVKWYKDYLKFDHIVVLDNESPVNIQDICNINNIEYHKIIGYPDQYTLYNTYVNNSKAWWVLPIDDDELLYLKKFKSINDFILNSKINTKYNKISFGWLNLFPNTFTETRICNIIENATAYSHKAVNVWQGDNIVKTMVLTTKHVEYKNSKYRHNPCVDGIQNSILVTGEIINTQKTKNYTDPECDAILLHYQFRTNSEWIRKCKLGSPGDKGFSASKQKAIDRYSKLYENQNDFKIFTKGLEIWNRLK